MMMPTVQLIPRTHTQRVLVSLLLITIIAAASKLRVITAIVLESTIMFEKFERSLKSRVLTHSERLLTSIQQTQHLYPDALNLIFAPRI